MFSSLPKDQRHSSSTGNTITNHVAKVLNGREHVASFQGRSQYGTEGGGVAACGLAALNCARVVLGKERDGVLGEQILSDLMKQETAEVSEAPSPTAALHADAVDPAPHFVFDTHFTHTGNLADMSWLVELSSLGRG